MAVGASIDRGAIRQAAPLGVWLLAGIAIGFRPALLNGWSAPLAGYPDSELVSFSLEHVHRCWFGAGSCASLVQVPMFHPFAYSGALTELQLPVVPIYSLFRLAGVESMAALLFTLLAQSVLTFLLVAILLRRGLDASPFEAGLGSFLVAFGSAKMSHIYHAYLFAQIPLLLALLLCQRLLARELGRHRPAAIAAVGALLSLQLYSSVNIAAAAFFFCLVAAVVTCGFPQERRWLRATVTSQPVAWVLGAALAVLTSLPLIVLLRRVRDFVEPLSRERLAALLPPPLALLNQGSRSWLGGRLAEWTGLPAQEFSWEFSLGLGVGATLLVLIGLPAGLRLPWLRAISLSSAAAWLLLLRWPGGFSAWPIVTAWLPPLEVLRAPARLHLLLLPVLAATAILGLRRLRGNASAWSRAAIVILVALVVLEQVRDWGMLARPTHPDPQQLSEAISPDCEAFFLSTHGGADSSRAAHLAAMSAAVASGVPTLNGYSGYRPRGWRLGNVEEKAPFSPELAERIERWREASGFRGSLCWLAAELGASSGRRIQVLRLGPGGLAR